MSEENATDTSAELRDEKLFKQPESSHKGDCPICFLPLPLDVGLVIMTCCSKSICGGCCLSFEEMLTHKCPFCRKPQSETGAEANKLLNDRVANNDPVAMREVGVDCYKDGDYQNAFQYFSKAAEMGEVAAHHRLALMYYHGQGVEKDESKAVHHYEQAAIGGHPVARHNLGIIEWNNDNAERAIKHWIIAAKLGFDDSLQSLKEEYAEGVVGKDDLAEALRGHQAAVDATKSPQREKALQAAVWSGSALLVTMGEGRRTNRCDGCVIDPVPLASPLLLGRKLIFASFHKK